MTHKKTNKRKTQLRKYAQLTGVGLQMGITIYLGAYFGKWLDEYFVTNSKIYTLILTMIAFVVSLISLVTQLKRINKKHDS